MIHRENFFIIPDTARFPFAAFDPKNTALGASINTIDITGGARNPRWEFITTCGVGPHEDNLSIKDEESGQYTNVTHSILFVLFNDGFTVGDSRSEHVPKTGSMICLNIQKEHWALLNNEIVEGKMLVCIAYNFTHKPTMREIKNLEIPWHSIKFLDSMKDVTKKDIEKWNQTMKARVA